MRTDVTKYGRNNLGECWYYREIALTGKLERFVLCGIKRWGKKIGSDHETPARLSTRL